MIDREGATPLYEQVADALADRIREGKLLPNRPLPSEHRIMQEFEVSRGTVRHAVALLRERGLVVTVPGRGTFVSKA
jgi:DNA-binding GntR family transcriptional regulator